MEDALPRPLSPIEYANSLESMSNEDFWKHAKSLATQSTRPMQESLHPTLPPTTLSCVTCYLRGGGSCVIPFSIIRAILPASQHITRLPDVPPWMIGILFWRGETMAAIDLCAYMAQRDVPHPKERITLITRHENVWLALCVIGIDETPTEVNFEQLVAFTPPPLPGGFVIAPRGIVGAWERKDTTSSTSLVLDIPEIFKDIMQRVESRDTHV